MLATRKRRASRPLPISHRAFVASALLACVAACSGDTSSTNAEPETGGDCGAPVADAAVGILTLDRVTNGFGQLLPYRSNAYDAFGNPTGEIVDIRSLGDVQTHVRTPDAVQPTPGFPVTATLPNGTPGNHHVLVQMSSAVDPESVFELTGGPGALSGTVTLLGRNSATGVVVPVPARVLVGGVTSVASAGGAQLETWAQFDPSSGAVLALRPEADGLPAASRARRRALVEGRAIAFVADTDGDLRTFESFPSGLQLELRIDASLASVNGLMFGQNGFVTTAVGADSVPPTVALAPNGLPLVTPRDGTTDVDPETELTVAFSEPVQPAAVGIVTGGGTLPLPIGAVLVSYGPAIPVALSALPMEPFDFSKYRITLAAPLPGSGPNGSFNDLNKVIVDVLGSNNRDLASIPGVQDVMTTFEVGPGIGIVNAPVLPDAVLAVRTGGGAASMSVVDLNGFGASTGNPVSTFPFPLKGESRFPYDPNLTQNPSARPLLNPGTTTFDGGSAGIFTLTLDTNLQDKAAGEPMIASMSDVHVGHALDTSFNNAPPPFGCQAGGGDVCSLDGLKVINFTANGIGQLTPTQPSAFGSLNPGYENLISWAPHPNPPQLVNPALCAAPLMQGNQPTSVGPPTSTNLLVPGDPFGDLATMTPPSGTGKLAQNAFFQGPTFGQVSTQNCSTYMIRQKVGHFVYVADRARDEIVVLDSNRMTLIDRIAVTDPTQLAMSPNLDLLAVTSALSDQVVFIDINPVSAMFHRVVGTTQVGDAPRGIACSPQNEDYLVCNEGDGTVSVISAFTLQVRKVVSTPAGVPFDVVMTPREVNHGFRRGVYYGYVLCRNGDVAVFESGPDGLNGWGYDDILGAIPFQFQAPKGIQMEPTQLDSRFMIAYEGPIDPVTGQAGALGDGAMSFVRIESALTGVIPLVPGTMPNFRSLQYGVPLTLSESAGDLSGIPTDVVVDEMLNSGGLPQVATTFSAGSPLPANGKGLIRSILGSTRSVMRSRYIMVATPDAGVVDVFLSGSTGTPRLDVDIYTAGTQSIEAPGTTALTTYWRQ